jgi:hypothetical protein
LKAIGIRNLEYEIRICQKNYIKGTVVTVYVWFGLTCIKRYMGPKKIYFNLIKFGYQKIGNFSEIHKHSSWQVRLGGVEQVQVVHLSPVIFK